MTSSRPQLPSLEDHGSRGSEPSEAKVVDLVLLGPPGCGKGTAAKLVAQALEVPHLSTGDMLRALDRDSDLGRRVFALIDNGNFVPDEMIAEMIGERLGDLDAAQGSVLDGFPRNLPQLPIYDALCDSLGRSPVYAELVVPEAVAVERMHGRAVAEGRADDTPEVIQKRLDVYREQTAPLVEALRSAGRLATVDALEPPMEVASALLDVLDGPALGLVL